METDDLPRLYRVFIGNTDWASCIIDKSRNQLDAEICGEKEIRKELFDLSYGD